MTDTVEQPRPVTFAGVAVGDRLPPLSVQLERVDLVRYCGASGDFNTIHWNQRVAVEVGLPDVIAHGMLTMAVAGRLVSDWTGDPGSVIDYGVRFTRPVVVPDPGGATLELSGAVSAKDDEQQTVTVDITATVEGRTVLAKAQATVRLH